MKFYKTVFPNGSVPVKLINMTEHEVNNQNLKKVDFNSNFEFAKWLLFRALHWNMIVALIVLADLWVVFVYGKIPPYMPLAMIASIGICYIMLNTDSQKNVYYQSRQIGKDYAIFAGLFFSLLIANFAFYDSDETVIYWLGILKYSVITSYSTGLYMQYLSYTKRGLYTDEQNYTYVRIDDAQVCLHQA